MAKIERRSAAAQAAIQSASVAHSASPLISLEVRQFIYSHVGKDQSPAPLPEDIIVAEILLRLPVQPLFRFKCVSKSYESFISDPEFARSYLQRAHSSPESCSLSGLSLLFPFTPKYLDYCLSKNVKDLNDSSVTLNHGDQDDQLPISLCSVSIPDDEQHEIRGSSNGLMLSGIYRAPRSRAEKCGRFFLSVSNPLTKQYMPIPQSTLFNYTEVVQCIATRPVCGDQAAAFLTYKIVIIPYKMIGTFYPEDNTNATVEIFSSDTGSWASWEVRGFPADFYYCGTVQANFAHRGVLHWLGRTMGTVIMYDPYNNPDRFDCIQLPKRKFSSSRYGSLIYSGDEEMVKYCEMDKGGSGVVRLMVWQLVDSEKGEWCMDGEFSFPSLPRLCKRLLVALNPCNRDIVCHPYVIDKSVMVINLRNGSWKFVNVIEEKTLCFARKSYKWWPLIPLELSPWSSPFYGQRS